MKKVKRTLNTLRLGAFPLAYGLTGAFIGGTLNRVMIADLNIPASFVGLVFALPLLVSPARMWLGYRSDAYPIFGRRRESYMLIGALIMGLAVYFASSLSTQSVNGGAFIYGGLLAAFILYGLGRNLSHNSFQALLADVFKGDARPRAVTGYEVVTLLGLVAGAGGLGQALQAYDPGRLVMVAVGVAAAALLLTLIAVPGQEPRGEQIEKATSTARSSDFRTAVTEYIWKDRQARLFFGLVFFTFVGTLAQDVLLEPYGALVLGMSVGETTRLTAFWGLGVMGSMLLSGVVLIKWLGHMRILRIGIALSIFVFAGLILVGLLGNPGIFRGLVFFMGLGTGLAGAGMLTGVINFTTEIRAGLLMGVWGMANMTGHAFGSLMGGGVVDFITRVVGGQAFVAYAAVFAIEVVMLIVAYSFTIQFDLGEARARKEAQQHLDQAVSAAI